MSKKHRHKQRCKVPKSGPVWHLSAEEATMLEKSRYNGFACGTGPHGDAKYNRAREMRAWKRDLRENGGPSLYLGSCVGKIRIRLHFLRFCGKTGLTQKYATWAFPENMSRKPVKWAPFFRRTAKNAAESGFYRRKPGFGPLATSPSAFAA